MKIEMNGNKIKSRRNLGKRPKKVIVSQLEAEMRNLVKVGNQGDTEYNHGEADELLCEALILFGQERLVKLWRKVHKWYS